MLRSSRLCGRTLGRRGQQASGSTTQVTQVHSPLIGCRREPGSQVQRLVELRSENGGLLSHVAQDGALRPRGDQRFRHSVDPHPGTATITSFLAVDALEREDAVGARELPEAQGHHSCFRRHGDILTSVTTLVVATRQAKAVRSAEGSPDTAEQLQWVDAELMQQGRVLVGVHHLWQLPLGAVGQVVLTSTTKLIDDLLPVDFHVDTLP